MTHATKVRRHSTAFQSGLRGGAEAEKKFLGGLVDDVPKEQDLSGSCANATLYLIVCSSCYVSVDIGMLIIECGKGRNWGEGE